MSLAALIQASAPFCVIDRSFLCRLSYVSVCDPITLTLILRPSHLLPQPRVPLVHIYRGYGTVCLVSAPNITAPLTTVVVSSPSRLVGVGASKDKKGCTVM